MNAHSSKIEPATLASASQGQGDAVPARACALRAEPPSASQAKPLVPIAGQAEMLIDDVSQIVARVGYIEVAPAHLFNPSLVAELADALDRLAVKVGKLTHGKAA